MDGMLGGHCKDSSVDLEEVIDVYHSFTKQVLIWAGYVEYIDPFFVSILMSIYSYSMSSKLFRAVPVILFTVGR